MFKLKICELSEFGKLDGPTPPYIIDVYCIYGVFMGKHIFNNWTKRIERVFKFIKINGRPLNEWPPW